MTQNPYLKAKQESNRRKSQYKPARKEDVPEGFMKNLAATYLAATNTARVLRNEASPVPQESPSTPKPNPYQSAQLSPAEQRRRLKAEQAQRQAEAQQEEQRRKEEARRLQVQKEQEQQKVNQFLENIRKLDPMHPDRRWFEDYKETCPSERQAALDLIRLSDS